MRYFVVQELTSFGGGYPGDAYFRIYCGCVGGEFKEGSYAVCVGIADCSTANGGGVVKCCFCIGGVGPERVRVWAGEHSDTGWSCVEVAAEVDSVVTSYIMNWLLVKNII